jgi:undecaprenyl-diphosphatase
MMSIAGCAMAIYHHTHPEQLHLKGWLTRHQADRWPIHSSNLAIISLITFISIYYQAPLERDINFHQWSIEWRAYNITEFWNYIARMNHEGLSHIMIVMTSLWLVLNKKVRLALIAAICYEALWLITFAIDTYAPIEKEFSHLSETSILIYLIALIANLYSNSLHGLKRWPTYLTSFVFMLALIISLMWTDQMSVSAGIASLSLGLFSSAVVRIFWQILHLRLTVPRPGGITLLLFMVTLAFAAII